MTPSELEAYLHRAIPLSAAMGIGVVDAPDGRRRYTAKHAANLNHRSTAFGGSVSALAIIAGWARVYVELTDRGVDAHTVIQRNQVEYEAPANESLWAVCEPVADAAWSKLVRGVERRGLGRVEVPVSVYSGDLRIASFKGTYVAQAKSRTT